MSQIAIATMGSSPVGPFVATLTGNDGVVVPASGSNNINVLGDDNFIVTTGNAGTNTLTISYGFPFTAQTTNATPVTVDTLAVLANTALSIQVVVVGAQNDWSNAVTATATKLYLRGGGGALAADGNAGSAIRTSGFDSTVGIFFDLSGNNALVQVKGNSSTINWKGTITILQYP